MVVDHRMDVVVTDPPLDPGRVPRPLARQPPPGGIRPSFFTSTWTSSPVVVAHSAARFAGWLGSPRRHRGRHSESLGTPARRSTRVTVRSGTRSGGQLGWAAAVLSAGGQDSALTAGVGCAEANDEVGSNGPRVRPKPSSSKRRTQRWRIGVRFPSLWRHGQQACPDLEPAGRG